MMQHHSTPQTAALKPNTSTPATSTSSFREQGKNILKWGIVLLVVGGILAYAVLEFPYYYPFPELTSWLAAIILNLIGVFSAPWGNYLVVEGLPPLEVSAECSGVVLMLIFPLTIFLMPVFPLTHRVASLLFVPFLFLGNTLRIVADVLVGLQFSPEALILHHDSVGQVMIFFWAIFMYIAWLIIFGHFPKEHLPKLNVLGIK
ncbi:MAG: exosortase/archaeosortase family protein [Candidatus Diapherotrites archaeon]|nr:exosortase/archaeosortase family protein [Candidatus Diapherotrites archaeon]MDZ4256189.1 exosortase/archaeosortase family protein [archaeon]